MPGLECSVGKTISAKDMLSAGRRGNGNGTTKQLDNQSAEPPEHVAATQALVAQSPSTPDVESTSRLDAQSPSGLVVEASKQLDAESTQTPAVTGTSRLVAESQHVTYQRATVFLRPDQRQWTKETVKGIPVEGLSASDIVRLAVDRLRQEVDGGLPLVEALTAQAYADAETMAGRRNRGLPPRSN